MFSSSSYTDIINHSIQSYVTVSITTIDILYHYDYYDHYDYVNCYSYVCDYDDDCLIHILIIDVIIIRRMMYGTDLIVIMEWY